MSPLVAVWMEAYRSINMQTMRVSAYRQKKKKEERRKESQCSIVTDLLTIKHLKRCALYILAFEVGGIINIERRSAEEVQIRAQPMEETACPPLGDG